MKSKSKPDKKLIRKIKKKFSTIARFSRIGGIDETLVRSALYRDNPISMERRKAIAVMADELKPGAVEGYDITAALREKIRRAIYHDYVSVTAFREKYPEFSAAFISNIFRKSAKTITPQVERLCEVLKIEI